MVDNISEVPFGKKIGDGEGTTVNKEIFDGMGGEGRKLRDLIMGLVDEVDRLSALVNGIRTASQEADFADFKTAAALTTVHVRLIKDGKEEFSPQV